MVLMATMSAFAWLLVHTARTQFTAQIASRVTAAAARDQPVSALPTGLPSRALPTREVDPNGRQTATLLFAADGTARVADRSGFADRPDPLPKLPPIGSAAHLHMIDRLTIVSSVDGSLRYLVMARRVAAGDFRFDAGSLAAVDRAIARLKTTALLVGFAAVAVSGAVCAAVLRRNFRPVDRMVQTAAAIAGGDLTARVPDQSPRSELGHLGSSLNAMLATIERALAERDDKEHELRRFVADASHELRTPLTAILGYGDLYRVGALDERDELDTAMKRIAGQAARMSRLVDDLLLLANSDRPDFLRVGPSDVAAIVREAADDFRVAGPAYPLTLDAVGDTRAAVDPDRIRQVVDNLLANIRVHTNPGTSVHVSVSLVSGAIVVRVADDGPGIAPDDRAHLFERFWRADGSRARRTGGSGLGLAIAASIVAAHNGRIEVEPGTPGTCIVVTIPVTTSLVGRTNHVG